MRSSVVRCGAVLPSPNFSLISIVISESENEKNIRGAVEATLEYMKSSVSQQAGQTAVSGPWPCRRAPAPAPRCSPCWTRPTSWRAAHRGLPGGGGARSEHRGAGGAGEGGLAGGGGAAGPGGGGGGEPEALRLKDGLRRARAELAEAEAGAAEGARLAGRVAEQGRRTEEICRVISQLVARDHLAARRAAPGWRPGLAPRPPGGPWPPAAR